MSGDYASRLKEYKNKGICGLAENCETKRSLEKKLQQLVELIQSASKIVVLTGAGISTAAGIPDFRGPKGVWTLEAKEKKRNKGKKTGTSGKRRRQDDKDPMSDIKGSDDNKSRCNETPSPPMQFNNVKPTFTHRALYYLWKKGQLQFLITQNVDGLHRRSGFPRDALAILHGCVFTEKCESCGQEHFRNTEVSGISFQRTGRHCTDCRGHLRDTLLDWCDHLPEDDWERCQDMCEEADLIITLGTSLRMEPAASLVTLGKQYVVVNLQETPYDDNAALVIRYKVDELFALLLRQLGYPHDWEKEYRDPEIESVSKSICPHYCDKWWKPPADEDQDDEDAHANTGSAF